MNSFLFHFIFLQEYLIIVEGPVTSDVSSRYVGTIQDMTFCSPCLGFASVPCRINPIETFGRTYERYKNGTNWL